MNFASRIGAFVSSLFSPFLCVNHFIGPPSLVAWRVQFVESVRKKGEERERERERERECVNESERERERESEREREREREGENESIHGKYEVSVLNQFLHTVNFV